MQLPSRSEVSHRQYYKLTRNQPIGRTTQAAHCAHGSAPTGALPWAQRCMRVDLSPWVRKSALTGTQFNATRFYYGQPLFSRPNYYCTFMTEMLEIKSNKFCKKIKCNKSNISVS